MHPDYYKIVICFVLRHVMDIEHNLSVSNYFLDREKFISLLY